MLKTKGENYDLFILSARRMLLRHWRMCCQSKYLKAYLQRHPGKIVSGNLARQICNLGKQEEDARKLKEIKESLYFLAEQKQTNLFRMARRLLDHHGNPSLVREIQEEAWKLTSHPEILLDEDELKYALLV